MSDAQQSEEERAKTLRDAYATCGVSLADLVPPVSFNLLLAPAC